MCIWVHVPQHICTGQSTILSFHVAPGFELRLSGKHLYPVRSLTAPKTHLIWSRNLHEEDRGDEPSGNQNTSL